MKKFFIRTLYYFTLYLRRELFMKKFIVTILMAALAVTFMSACGNGNGGGSGEAEPWRPQPAVFNDDWDTIIMGTSAGFFPFEFIARPGEAVNDRYAGIDISLAARISRELEVNIEIMDMEFAGLITALQAREVDFVAAAMTIRPDRAESVNFSIPYFTAGQWVVVQTGSPYNSMTDLAGRSIGVQIGTTGDFAVTDALNDGDIDLDDIVRFNQPAPGMLELIGGSIDAFVIDAAVARAFAATYSDRLRAFPDTDFFGAEQYGMAFHLEDLELRDRFNAVLQGLIAEGYIDYLYDNYTAYFSPAD